MATRRTDLKNNHIFNKDGHGAGIWNGAGTTKTKPSRTLFVTSIPKGVTTRQLEELFGKEPGFDSVRFVRRMCFVDFDNERRSTAAMRKFQGYKFGGARYGLALDFDKDAVGKRNRAYEKDLAKRGPTAAPVDRYYCTKCDLRCLLLDKLKSLSDMPRRSTDNSYCVNEAKYLRALNVVKGEPVIIQREKGKERQYPLKCMLCDSVVAYRPKPIGTDTKFLYVLPGALQPHGATGMADKDEGGDAGDGKAAAAGGGGSGGGEWVRPFPLPEGFGDADTGAKRQRTDPDGDGSHVADGDAGAACPEGASGGCGGSGGGSGDAGAGAGAGTSDAGAGTPDAAAPLSSGAGLPAPKNRNPAPVQVTAEMLLRK